MLLSFINQGCCVNMKSQYMGVVPVRCYVNLKVIRRSDSDRMSRKIRASLVTIRLQSEQIPTVCHVGAICLFGYSKVTVRRVPTGVPTGCYITVMPLWI